MANRCSYSISLIMQISRTFPLLFLICLLWTYISKAFTLKYFLPLLLEISGLSVQCMNELKYDLKIKMFKHM